MSARPHRRSPLFVLALGACVTLALAEIAFAFARYRASTAAIARLEQKRAQLRQLVHSTPRLTEEIAAQIEGELARARHIAAAMKRDLRGGGDAERIRNTKPPATRTDAFFDLATFVERMRESAKKRGIEIGADAARFGFAAYANEAPETERIAPVFRQRLIVQHLVETLFEARPRALLSVRREMPSASAERQAREVRPGGVAPAHKDLFVLDPRSSVEVPGQVDAMGFQLAFVGETASLRALLNRFAASDLPIVVREVEVRAAAPDEIPGERNDETPAFDDSSAPSSVVLTLDAPIAPSAARMKNASRASASAPVIAKAWSKFTVTLQYLELANPGASSGPSS